MTPLCPPLKFLRGTLRYASVRTRVGAVSTFNKEGGARFACTHVGA